MRRLLALLALLLACTGAPAFARDHLTGIVLMQSAPAIVLVHHEAFAGMPSMTMEFSVPAGTVLHPGDHITADVDRAHDPWTLSGIHVTTAGVSAPHYTLPAFLNVGDTMPNITFVDQRGKHETLAALRGHPYVLTFMYTRCRAPPSRRWIWSKSRSIRPTIARPCSRATAPNSVPTRRAGIYSPAIRRRCWTLRHAFAFSNAPRVPT
jgi:hypothetical protein